MARLKKWLLLALNSLKAIYYLVKIKSSHQSSDTVSDNDEQTSGLKGHYVVLETTFSQKCNVYNISEVIIQAVL